MSSLQSRQLLHVAHNNKLSKTVVIPIYCYWLFCRSVSQCTNFDLYSFITDLKAKLYTNQIPCLLKKRNTKCPFIYLFWKIWNPQLKTVLIFRKTHSTNHILNKIKLIQFPLLKFRQIDHMTLLSCTTL